MKKVIGYILIVCGVLSLPGFLSKISNAHDGYEVIGMLIGQGLIFFLAYLCLRGKKKESQQQANPSEPIESLKNDTLDIENSTETKNEKFGFEGQSQGKEGSIFKDVVDVNNDSIVTYSQNEMNEKSDISPIENDLKTETEVEQMSENESPIHNYQKLETNNITWTYIYTLIFNYQKKELLSKCNPLNFMNPYNHDNIAIANESTQKINEATSLSDLKPVRLEVAKLNIFVDPSQIYDYLCVICNPTRYTGKLEEFQLANNLYERIVNSGMDYEVLEGILEDAHASKLGIIEEPIPMAKKTITTLTLLGIWEIILITLWGAKGCLYNATSYFFPFQTTNIAKFDFSEFCVYGIVLPIVTFGIFKVLNKFNQ